MSLSLGVAQGMYQPVLSFPVIFCKQFEKRSRSVVSPAQTILCRIECAGDGVRARRCGSIRWQPSLAGSWRRE